MRDVRALLSLFLIAAATAASRAGSVDAPSSARASMVIVSSNIAEHRDAIGAGVVVAVQPWRVRVVTARHVADRGPVTVWIDGRPLPAEIVRTFANSDLAVVDASGFHLDRLRLRPAPIAPGTSAGSDLFIWGENETGLRIQRASVVSAAYDAPDGSGMHALVSISCASCAPGDSGGGMFDAGGRLIGILTARYHTHDDRTVAIVGERVDASFYAITDGPGGLAATSPSAP